MKYATLCTGIAGFDLALDRNGMECVYQCEIDAHCHLVLDKHYPQVPKGVDVNEDGTAAQLVRLKPDLVAFGSPCQDLSVAGKRAGISGERSGVFFRCMELCLACEAPWILWENVPGVFSSNDGRDFATVLEAFTGTPFEVPTDGWKNTGVAIGPLYSLAWSVLDAQWFGVPQRRRRVFIVGSLTSRSGPYEILSLASSLPWDSPPSRETGQRIAASLTAGTSASSGVNPPGRRREDDVNIVASTLVSKDGRGVHSDMVNFVAHTLRGEGVDASEDGTGRGTPLVPVAIQERAVSENLKNGPQGKGYQEHIAYTLEARHHQQSVAHSICLGSDPIHARELAMPQTTRNGDPGVVQRGTAVRRLTPVECLRLQGFPDDWLDDLNLSDSAKYKMCGNSVAVPVIKWIGERIVASATPNQPNHEGE